MPRNANSAMTPSRATRVIFDESYTAVGARQWGAWRFDYQIASLSGRNKGVDDATTQSIYHLASGAWGIRPIQLTNGFAEVTHSVASVYVSGTDLTTVSGYNYPKTTLGDNDPYFKKDGYNQDYSTTLSPPANISGLYTALNTAYSLISPLDAIAHTTSNHSANRGFCIKFVVPGVSVAAYDYIGAVTFGQYAVVIRGDGMAQIWEYATPSGGSAAWYLRESFQYCRPNLVAGNPHMIVVWPHLGRHGEKYISFIGNDLEAAQSASAGNSASPASRRATGGAFSTREFLFRWDDAKYQTTDGASGANVTTAAKIWILERRNINCEWQISRLVWPTTGTLTSDFWVAEPSDNRTLNVEYIATLPSGSSVSYVIKDATGSTVTTTTAGDSFYLVWTLTGPETDSPLLWGTKCSRSVSTYSASLTSFTVQNSYAASGNAVGVGATDYQISAGKDAREERASLRVNDPIDTYRKLRQRAELPVRIVVQDSSSGSPVDVTLFKGWAIEPTRRKRGKASEQSGFSGASAVYPSAQWSEYQISAAGMWHHLSRVTTRTALSWQDFAQDPLAGTGSGGQLLAWKVTDAIKHLLTIAGFPSSMQDIPDLDMRLPVGVAAPVSDQILDSSVSIAEMISRMARNYLGRFLVFDANNGTDGKWTLVGAPSGTPTPLAAFVGSLSWTPGDPWQVQHSLASYPANTAPTFGEREYHYIRPEFNHLWAFTLPDSFQTGGFRIDNHLYNHLSYKVPGSSTTPSQTSPHYVGTERLAVLGDPALWAGAYTGAWADTQKYVNYILLRVFAFACLPREVCTFEAPLLFVTDPSHGAKRPLRHYDVVTLDTENWYVRSVEINYTNDQSQRARYTLERFVAYAP